MPDSEEYSTLFGRAYFQEALVEAQPELRNVELFAVPWAELQQWRIQHIVPPTLHYKLCGPKQVKAPRSCSTPSTGRGTAPGVHTGPPPGHMYTHATDRRQVIATDTVPFSSE